MSSGTDTGCDHNALINKIYPIGSIYITVTNINPNTTFGVGTWQAFGTGRTLVGIDTNQGDFDTVGKTGGVKEHVLTAAEMPKHTHICNNSAQSNTGTPSNSSTDKSGSHSHWIRGGLPLEVGSIDQDRPDTYSFGDNLKRSGQIFHAHEDLTVDGIQRDSKHTHLHSHTHTVVARTHTNQESGGGVAHKILQPYIVVYMWQRVS